MFARAPSPVVPYRGRKDYRPGTEFVAARLVVSSIVIFAASFFIYCARLLDGAWVVALNAFIILLALCHAIDGLFARLTLDDEAIEVRTFNVSGPDVYWLEQAGKDAEKIEREIQNWQRTLTFDASDIARGVARPRLQKALWPALVFYGGYIAWGMRDAPELVLIVAPLFVSPLLWWMRMNSRLANAPMTIPGVTGGSAKWRIVLFVFAAIMASIPPVELPDVAAGRLLALKVTAGVFLAMWPLIYRRRLSGAAFATGMIAILCYCYGGVNLANAAFDRSAPVRHSFVVVGKRLERVSTGKGGASYIDWITLRSPDEIPQDREIKAGQPFYVSIEVGDSVCYDLRKGRLGIEWYKTLFKCGVKRPNQ